MKTVIITISIALLTLISTLSFATEIDEAKQQHQQTIKKFTHILNEQWGIDKEKITGESYFLRDFGADSLDIIELVMALEEYFDITIYDEEWEEITTVNSAVKLIIYKKEQPYYYR